MPLSEATYERVALEDPQGQWELVCGRLRGKPGMTFAHSHVLQVLSRLLVLQVDPHEWAVTVNHTRLRIASGSFYIPDLCVIPGTLERRKLQEAPGLLEVYEEPMPLVVEVWSPSTGDYDAEQKLRDHQQRCDLEIWRIHPYEQTLIAWARQPDGSYTETRRTGGGIRPVAFPHVEIQIGELFER